MRNYEYSQSLKQSLENIQIDNSDIMDLTNSLECTGAYKNLFAVFLSKLREVGVNDETRGRTCSSIDEILFR